MSSTGRRPSTPSKRAAHDLPPAPPLDDHGGPDQDRKRIEKDRGIATCAPLPGLMGGAPPGSRTLNQRIKSPLLYR